MTMIASTVVSAPSLVLSDLVSPVIVQMIGRVQPSVVQVRSAGRGGGAGVIWHANGATLILTNNHVVADRDDRLQVQLTDGRTFDTTISARNPSLDLALLTAAADDLPAAPIGDSSRLRVGELVFAIGHPWGQRGVVTAGIVSGLGAIPIAGNGRTAQYIRTDVRLAPGNSGGPLLNAEGAVVGINAMIFGGDLSVAIPSHVASAWIAGLPGRRVFLGVQVQAVELPASVRQGRWAEQVAGLLVVGVEPGGPADRAGVLVGDVLLAAAGAAVEDPGVLRDILAQHDTAEPLQLDLLRGGVVQTLAVNLGWTERRE
jgi:serine protease Do